MLYKIQMFCRLKAQEPFPLPDLSQDPQKINAVLFLGNDFPVHFYCFHIFPIFTLFHLYLIDFKNPLYI